MIKDVIKFSIPLLLLLVIVKVFLPSYFDVVDSLINLLLGVILVYAASRVEIEEMRSSTQRQIDALKEMNEKIETGLERMVGELKIVSDRLKAIGDSMMSLEKSFSKTKKEYEKKKKELEDVQAKIEKEEEMLRHIFTRPKIGIILSKKGLLSREYFMTVLNKGDEIRNGKVKVALIGRQETKELMFEIGELYKGMEKTFKLPDLKHYEDILITISFEDALGNRREVSYGGKIEFNYIYGLDKRIRKTNIILLYLTLSLVFLATIIVFLLLYSNH